MTSTLQSQSATETSYKIANIMNSKPIPKKPFTTHITGQFMAETKYDSLMFRVVEWVYADNHIRKYLKDYEDSKYIYLKKKVMKRTDLEKLKFYKMKLTFAQFVNKDLDLVKYIRKVTRIKEVEEPKNPSVFDDTDSESE